MDPTIKVKNEHSDVIKVASIGAGNPISIGVGAEADLTGPYLQSKSFGELLAEGKLSFILAQNPSEAQYKLARQVLPMVLLTLSGRFLNLHSTLKKSTEDLEKRKEQYNQSWSAAEKVVEKAETSANGSGFLVAGVKHYVNTKPEEAAVQKIKDEIKALEAEDLSATHRTLAEWYAERQAKEQELKKAETQLAAAKALYESPLKVLLGKLEAAVADFKSADPSTDIGSSIADW